MTDLARRTDPGVPIAWERVSIVDLLDRVLGAGVVITGDVTLSIADVDLVYVSLNAIIASVRPDGPLPWPAAGPLVREAW
jgi:hypothetical protein